MEISLTNLTTTIIDIERMTTNIHLRACREI